MFRTPQFLAAHMDPLVFLILLLVSGIFRLLSSKAKSQKREKDSTPERPEPTFERPRAEDTDQERIRRFLEALGQPTSAAPPLPVKPRPVENYEAPQREERARTVRPRNILNPVPPLTTVPPPLPRKVQIPRQITTMPETKAFKAFTPRSAPVEEYQVQETTATPAPPLLPLATPADAYAAATKPAPAGAGVPARPAIAALLATPETLRQAILLREILGPPRALSPLEM